MEQTQERWTEEFKKMAKGQLGYTKGFYTMTYKPPPQQTGSGTIQMVEPTQQQVAQARMQVKHDLEEEREAYGPPKRRSRKKPYNELNL